MNVSLNISEDKELRDAIKDMVRGQVTSIVREELKAFAREALLDKLKSMRPEDMRTVLGMNKYQLSDAEIRIIAQNAINETLVRTVAKDQERYIKNYVDTILKEALKDMAQQAIKDVTTNVQIRFTGYPKYSVVK